MKKTIISMALAVVMAMGLTVPAFAAQVVPDENGYYNGVHIGPAWGTKEERIEYELSVRQESLDGIMGFLDAHPLAEIWTYSGYQELAAQQLAKKIVGDETNPKK